MAKQVAAGFDIPDQSLVKVEAEEGSTEWMRRVTKENGDTSPQKLEKRRDRIGAFAVLMDKSLKNLRMKKKVYLARNKKAQEDLTKRMKALVKDSTAFAADMERSGQHMAQLQLECIAQEQQYDMLINQGIFNQAMVEGQCLIVDCLTLRELVKSKSGKKGFRRYSSALYALDNAYFAGTGYRRLRKLFDLMAAQADPLIAGSVKDDDEDDDGEGVEYDDEDVVNEEDRKRIEEEVGDGDVDFEE